MAYTTINKSSDYFDIRTYSASGAGSISDLNFQPDFIWFKNRASVGDHGLFDAIRGVTKYLQSNNSSTGLTGNGSNDFTAFTSNGFNYGASSQLDTGSGTPVTWCWKANGTGSSNTDGSINSTVSVNTTSGFSIVSYTGTGANATVGHGLGVAPKMVILKSTANAYNWGVYHASVGATKYLRLNSTNAESSASSSYFQNTAPSNTLITLGSDLNMNDSGNMIAYCFSEKKGYSKFGKYLGTGSSTGTPFIYTGFRPAFVMTKVMSGGNDAWSMTDIPRDNAVGGDGNSTGARLTANETAAESTNTSWASIQKYSNGFSPQGTDGVTNATGYTYIYMAFAEAPLVGTNNVPANAR